VLLSIPSAWNDEPPTSRYAHMVAGCDTDRTSLLTAMNPWGGFYQRQSLAWWRERLDRCSYQPMWIMERVGERGMAWTFLPDGTAHDAVGGITWGRGSRGRSSSGGLRQMRS
jgi:hypothetical protein